MKVKIFTESYSNDSVEEKINKWLDKEHPEIKFIEQSESMTGSYDIGGFNLTISVWYEPNKL